MSSSEIYLVDKTEHVEVSLTLEVNDCLHMNELLLNVSSAVASIQTKKITLLDAEIAVIDLSTGQLKYDDDSNDAFLSSDGYDIDMSSGETFYRLSNSGVISTVEDLVVFDPKEDAI
jgi:hypothetical protein